MYSNIVVTLVEFTKHQSQIENVQHMNPLKTYKSTAHAGHALISIQVHILQSEERI